MASWPASITADCWRQEDYTQTPPDVTLRTEMDAGPAKARRRFTATTAPLTGSLTLTSAQMADLLTFYAQVGGFTSFDSADPYTGAYQKQRFVKPPSFKQLGGGNWQVMLNLEIMPS